MGPNLVRTIKAAQAKGNCMTVVAVVETPNARPDHEDQSGRSE
jgi:hypothetical protein